MFRAYIQAVLDFAARVTVRPQGETFLLSQKWETDAMQKHDEERMRYRAVVVV
jgi:D-arabinose 1-dehydrogenase-like Zn-dependent alcohol dehydrogenase